MAAGFAGVQTALVWRRAITKRGNDMDGSIFLMKRIFGPTIRSTLRENLSGFNDPLEKIRGRSEWIR